MSADERPAHTPAESEGNAPGRGRLNGRRILVIGGGQEEHGLAEPPVGNGRAMSILFAREGARVAVADRRLAAAEATVALVRKAHPESSESAALAIEADVTVPEQIEAMVERASQAFGGLDGVIYNVGFGNQMWLSSVTQEGWDLVFAANLRGAALALKAALPKLSAGSSVVLISSTASLRPGSRIPAYDASKAGMAGLMRHAAFEGARNRIRVNVVAPGLMDTSLGRIASQKRPNRASTPIPLGRQGTGWETAYMSLFLISDEAAYVTGQVFVVDGGLGALR
jgi:NAD(P)-dependent dehydrogenase (short-subunit alcohol dehydrogenase family)